MTQKQSDVIFNAVSLFFVAMALLICLFTVVLMADVVEAPGSLAPQTAVPIPTYLPSQTPIPQPDAPAETPNTPSDTNSTSEGDNGQ